MHPITQAAGGGAVFLAVFALGATAVKLGDELGASSVPTSAPVAAQRLTVDITARCAEDSPCWAWSTMGNRRRGVLVDGAPRVVSACTYRKLRIARLIDPATPRLHGDGWALTNGCGPDATVSVHPSGVAEG